MDIALDKEFLQSFNVSSLKEFVDWQQLKKISETNNLQPDSALALASFIGKNGEYTSYHQHRADIELNIAVFTSTADSLSYQNYFIFTEFYESGRK